MEYILGIDIGTGSTKAVAVGLDHIAFESSQFFYPTETLQSGYSEQNPELIWKAFQQCIEEIISKLGENPIAISFSSAMHSVIPVNEKGQALAPMMTWADSRSTDISERLLSTPIGMELYRLTGTPIHSMSPLCKLIWIKENQPELFNKTFKFISVKEYIWYHLFHQFEVDYSIGSCTGLMELEKRSWSEKALEIAGLTAAQLSTLVPVTHQRKDLQFSFPSLKNGTPFIIGASDGCLANLGTGAFEPGKAALTIGTSGALRVASDKPLYNDKSMTFSYLLDDDIYINGGPINNGGVALKWHLKNQYQKDELTDQDYNIAMDKVKNLRPGADGLLFLPYLQGERAPIWDAKSCGTFFGITLKHHAPHFTRAVVEGICFALNDVLQSLVESAQQIDQINVSGGFVSSPVWLQILADITGKELWLASTEDASAVGAAYLAMKTIGHTEHYPLPSPKDFTKILPNEINHLSYQKYFKRYKELYQNLKKLMHEWTDDQ